MVEFTTESGTVRVNPALVVGLAHRGTNFTRIAMASGEFYDVGGTIAEVDDKLQAHYTDVRYLAFVIEALCTHLKVEIVRPPSQQTEQES